MEGETTERLIFGPMRELLLLGLATEWNNTPSCDNPPTDITEIDGFVCSTDDGCYFTDTDGEEYRYYHVEDGEKVHDARIAGADIASAISDAYGWDDIVDIRYTGEDNRLVVEHRDE